MKLTEIFTIVLILSFFDLEQSKPSVLKSERKDDGVFTASYAYRYQWKILKEKYGEHFKS